MTASASVIDVHSHFVTPKYAEAAIAAGHDSPDGMPGWPDWNVDDHLRLMDECGIDRAVLSISSPGVHFGDDEEAHQLAVEVNDFAARLCAERPDRFQFFASLPLPAVDASLQELARAVDELGASGVIVESNAHGTYLGSADYGPVWHALNEREATIFVHPTSPPGWQATSLGLPRPMMEFLFDTTRTIVDFVLAGFIDEYPALKIVVPHSGAMLPLLTDRVSMFQSFFELHSTDSAEGEPPNFSTALKSLWYDLAGTPLPVQAAALINLVGTDHIVYGSDYCWTPAAAVAQQISELDAGWGSICETPWRDLTTDNGRLLLGDTRAISQ